MGDSRILPLVLGRYELHSVIATGGMASIHLGRLCGSSGFTRTVAVKRLHPHYASDPEFVRMFLDEARLVARIRHPNVVPIVDVVAETDELFLVMEYVHGESLARLVHVGGHAGAGSHAVPPSMAAGIFVDVLHGLHAAHEAKTPEGEPLAIVHRDVTPHNVLVGLDGSARIADFGIAKATQGAPPTGGAVLKGKLCYIAPEQLHGRDVGRVTDVYSAAVSLWEALTGRMLFAAENEGHVVEKILTGATRPPSAFAPDIPPELDDIVMRGLEMKPHKRFQTAQEMALALEKSVAIPPASEIGAWVQTRAEAAIAKRVALIQGIERTPRVATRPRAGSGRSGIAVAGVALTALVGISAVLGGAFLAHLRATPRPAAETLAHRATAPQVMLPPVTPLAIAQLTPAPPAALDVAPPPPKVARSRKAAAATSATEISSAKAPDDACKLPYTRDETGRKIYKRECL